jgi:hypothetical protein
MVKCSARFPNSHDEYFGLGFDSPVLCKILRKVNVKQELHPRYHKATK